MNFSLLVVEVAVGSWVKWGPWSASVNLLSDLKKILFFFFFDGGFRYVLS